MNRNDEQLSTTDIVNDDRHQAEDPSRRDNDRHRVGRGGGTDQLLDDAGRAEQAHLFSDEDGRDYHDRWVSIQGTFVDDPRAAVEGADELVAEVIRRLAETFSGERESLEQQWADEGDVSTEDLRVALQRYRTFFNRLLDV